LALGGTVFLALNSTLGAVGVADELGSYLRKLIAMPYFKRGGFKREFLEINGILMSCIKHARSDSPTNEGFQSVF
jgi:hypothetical protein